MKSFIVSKRDWIYRKLAEKDALLAPPVRKQFVNGEGFVYLGRNHRLLLVDDQQIDVKLERGRFKMRNDRAASGSEVMRQWYTSTGQTWLRGRVQPWARRLQVGEVKGLGEPGVGSRDQRGAPPARSYRAECRGSWSGTSASTAPA